MSTSAAVPGQCTALPDPMAINDAACTLVELSTVPEHAGLWARAAEQLPPLTEAARRMAGTADSVNDAEWLNPWRSYGIVVERT